MSGYYVGKYVPVRGPLAQMAEGFAGVLWECGYSHRTVDAQMRMLRDLSGWLDDRGVALAALDDGVVEAYVSDRRARTQTLKSSRGLVPLLGFLREQGVVPPPSLKAVAEGPARVLAQFKEYLLGLRGLSEATAASYCSQVWPLVQPVGAEGWASL